MKVHSVVAVRMPGGKLFHAAGPATLNARFPRRRLVRGTTRSPRAAEWRAERVETVDTGTHKSCMSLVVSVKTVSKLTETPIPIFGTSFFIRVSLALFNSDQRAKIYLGFGFSETLDDVRAVACYVVAFCELTSRRHCPEITSQ